jgi:hypothetical protein
MSMKPDENMDELLTQFVTDVERAVEMGVF